MASNTQIIIVLLFCGFALFSLGWIANDIYWTANDIFGKKKAGANQQSKSTKNISQNTLKSKLICCNIACKYNGNGTCDRGTLTIGMDGNCSDKWSSFDEFV